MEQATGVAVTIATWSGYLLWITLMLGSLLTIFIGLPGGWIALGLSVLYDLIWGFHALGWKALAFFAALIIAGEIIESLLGTLYVAKKGATSFGIAGAFLGGLAGAVAGSNVLPLAGTIIGSFAGAFVGAVAGEYLKDQRLTPSMRVGLHALVGKILASTIKFALALAGATTMAALAWPAGA